MSLLDRPDISRAAALAVQGRPIPERRRIRERLDAGVVPPEVQRYLDGGSFEQKHGDKGEPGYALLHPGPGRMVALSPLTRQPTVGRVLSWGARMDLATVTWQDDSGMTWEIPVDDLRIDGQPLSDRQQRDARQEVTDRQQAEREALRSEPVQWPPPLGVRAHVRDIRGQQWVRVRGYDPDSDQASGEGSHGYDVTFGRDEVIGYDFSPEIHGMDDTIMDILWGAPTATPVRPPAEPEPTESPMAARLREQIAMNVAAAASTWEPLVVRNTTPRFYGTVFGARDDDGLVGFQHALTAAHAMYDMDYTTPDGTRMSARVGGIVTRPRGISVSGVVWAERDGKWIEAGEFQRVVRLEERSVSHQTFKVADPYQGMGFGEAFIAHSEAEYLKAGMREVLVEAGMTGGGYAWARMGFDWNPGDPGDSMGHIVGGIFDVWDTNWYDRARNGIVAETERMLRAFGIDPSDEKYHVEGGAGEDDFEPTNWDTDEWPTPYEIAMLGYDVDRGHGAGVFWPGKGIMRGSNWNGIKRLEEPAMSGKALVREAGERRTEFLARVAAERTADLARLLASHGSLGDEAVDWVDDDDR